MVEHKHTSVPELWEPGEEVPALIRKWWPQADKLDEAKHLLFPKGVPQEFGQEEMVWLANQHRQRIWREYKTRGQAYLDELAQRPD